MIEELHDLLQSSKLLIPSIGSVTADNILKSLDKAGVDYDFVRLSRGDWEIESSELTDSQIFRMLNLQDAGHDGILMICTEACSRYGYNPFTCDSVHLEQFIGEYDIEMFFDGDVVILCKQTRTLTVFHHAGGYAHVKL